MSLEKAFTAKDAKDAKEIRLNSEIGVAFRPRDAQWLENATPQAQRQARGVTED